MADLRKELEVLDEGFYYIEITSKYDVKILMFIVCWWVYIGFIN